MSAITKQWLQQKISGMEATRDEIPFGLGEDDSNTLAALRIALASLEAEAVSVQDERYQHLSEIYHAQEKRLFKLAQRIKGPSFDKYAYSPSQAIDALESAIFGAREDACRAAMLQSFGNSEQLNSPVIPDGWVACSERMPEIGIKVLCFPVNDEPMHATYNGQVWLQDISWSVSDEPIDNVISCNVFHWMPLPAAPRQEVK